MACGLIDRGSAVDICDDIAPGGTRARVVLFNIDEIESFTEDADGNITAITLVSGATGFEFTGFRNDAKKSEEVIKPDIGLPKFKHNAGFVIYENTQIQKNNIENLVRGRFVALIENKGKTVDSIEVVGKEVGLEIVAGPIRNAHENGGFFVISLSTPDDQGELEGKLPQTLLVAGNTYASNLAYIAGLLPAS
jgi:hypothetical protein